MTRKLTIVAMVVLAAILVATPVLAAGSSNTMGVNQVAKKWKKPTVISMTGTILKIGTDPDTGATEAVKIHIKMTNRAFIQYRGVDKWVDTNDLTKYILWVNGKPTKDDFDFEDLTVGDKLSINAKVAGEVFTARRVQVRQQRYN